jgi:hypothetical protein
MPLTPDERTKIVEVETLKAEIQRDLRPESESRCSSFSQQVVLLILGFVCTTLVGGALTYFWKERDWRNQQSYLAAQRALDKKYAVIDKTFKEVAATTAAADDVLASYYAKNLVPKDINERMDNWHKTSRDWRVASKVLSASLAANFCNQKVSYTFQEIINKRRQLGVAITNLPRPAPGADIPKEIEPSLKQANDLINEIVDLLQKCGALMMAETKASSNP